MPYSGSGVFSPLITFADNTDATAADQNSQDGDIAGGLTQAMTRAGLAAATANIPMGGFKFTGLGMGSASADSVSFGQLSAYAALAGAAFGGAVSFGSTISVTGTATFGAATFGSTISVTGAATFAAASFSGAVTVPTAAPGNNSTNAASTAFATAADLVAVPAQAGNAGRVLKTNASVTSWSPLTATAMGQFTTNGTGAPAVVFVSGLTVVRASAGVWTVTVAGLANANYAVSASGGTAVGSSFNFASQISGKSSSGFTLSLIASNGLAADPTVPVEIDIIVIGGV